MCFSPGKNLEKEEVIEQTRAQLFAIHEQLEKQKESYEDVYEQVQAVIKAFPFPDY
jgi:hypothetical protein